jgi:hypothetical protein
MAILLSVIREPGGGRRGQRPTAEQQREEEAEAGQEEARAGAFSPVPRSAPKAGLERRPEEVLTLLFGLSRFVPLERFICATALQSCVRAP